MGAPTGPTSLPLDRQHLLQECKADLLSIVEDVAGLNAQTKRGPAVGLWTRAGDLDLRELDHHLQSYDLVRANLMRATVHLVTRRQFSTWRAALQPTLRRAVNQYCRGLLATVDENELLEIGRSLLRRYNGLTRSEIGRHLHDTFPQASPADLGFAIRMLLPVLEKPAPSNWNAAGTRYVLADQVMDWHPAPAEQGRHDLISSFLRGFGPAALPDFTYWSDVTGLRGTGIEPPTTAPNPPGEAAGSSRSSIVLPEFDNIYFCRKTSSAQLYQAKKRNDFQPARMPGSLVQTDHVVATWTASKTSTEPILHQWKHLDRASQAEWGRFASWYSHNST